MKLYKNFSIVMIFILISSIISTAEAQEPFFSYTYDYWGEPVSAPHAYLPVSRFGGNDLGVGNLSNPRDMFVDQDNTLYIVDSGNNRILKVSEDLSDVHVIDGFDALEGRASFIDPQGIFVTNDGEIYVADTGNSRIVHLDANGDLVRIVGPPVADIIPQDFVYQPSKVAVDSAGRIYVIATGVTQGVTVLDAQGNFQGFMGASRVRPSVMDIFWRAIATEAQRERMILFIPTEYNNITIDGDGFLYVTTDTLTYWNIQYAVNSRARTDQVAPVRKLNPTGADVLRREGFFPPVGDIDFGYMDHSLLVDVDVGEHGMYSVLDRRKGRIFTYDANGNLLFVFGGLGGARLGTFRNPVAIERIGEHVLVLDSMRAQITKFEITEYGRLLKEAIVLHQAGDYTASAQRWEQVLKKNANADLAYIGIGMAYMRQDEFAAALDHFRLGSMRERFSRAFQLYRREVIGRNFGLIAIFVVLLVGLIMYITKVKRRKSMKGGVEI